MASIIILLICIPFISALLIFIGGRRTERDLGLGAFIASILTVPLLLPLIAYVQSNESYAFTLIESSRYLPFTVGFMVDSLSLILLIAISVLSTLSVLYSLKYVKALHDINSYYSGLLIFMGGMIGVVLASDMILFYLFWEMVLVASWALVTYWGETVESYRIGLKYFFFTHVGAILILVGILWVYSLTGSTSMHGLTYGSNATFSILKTIAIFFVIGFGIKMAIFPFHSWLPDAHTVAQLPITIMLAAIMLSTGAYGLMRFLFNVLLPLH
jgi:formate hydrogenlyase subunit 3/multisubunit Na+/H+ antiporter MnhD subunit